MQFIRCSRRIRQIARRGTAKWYEGVVNEFFFGFNSPGALIGLCVGGAIGVSQAQKHNVTERFETGFVGATLGTIAGAFPYTLGPLCVAAAGAAYLR